MCDRYTPFYFKRAIFMHDARIAPNFVFVDVRAVT